MKDPYLSFGAALLFGACLARAQASVTEADRAEIRSLSAAGRGLPGVA